MIILETHQYSKTVCRTIPAYRFLFALHKAKALISIVLRSGSAYGLLPSFFNFCDPMHNRGKSFRICFQQAMGRVFHHKHARTTPHIQIFRLFADILSKRFCLYKKRAQQNALLCPSTVLYIALGSKLSPQRRSGRSSHWPRRSIPPPAR